MGVVNLQAILDHLTLGKKKIFADCNNLFLKGANYKISKDELLSIFTDKNDRETAEQYFNYFNSRVGNTTIFDFNKTKDSPNPEPDDYLDLKEIKLMISELITKANKDDIEENLSEEEVENYTGIKGADVLFKMIKKITETKDYSVDIKSGDFIVNGENKYYNVTQSKENPRVYRFENSDGNFTATFGGPDSMLQVMTSAFYSMAFSDANIDVEYIVSPDGEKGSTWCKKDLSTLNKTKKLGLDAFLGNLEGLPNFSGAFDIDSHNQKKSFTFIPEEFENLIEKDNYTPTDVLNAIKFACGIKDSDIRETLAVFDYQDQYEETLIKRKHFLREMLKLVKDNPPKNEISAKDYFTKLKLLAMKNILQSTTTPADLISFQKSIDNIEDIDTKIELQRIFAEKRQELSSANKREPLPEIKEDELIEFLNKYGYSVDNRSENFFDMHYERSTIKRLLTTEETSNYMAKYKEDADIVIRNAELYVDLPDVLKFVNIRRKQGVDILESKELFDRNIVMANLTHDLNVNGREYDNNTYDLIQKSFENPPVGAEKAAIKVYKSSEFWRINNAISTQRNDDIEPLPMASEYIDNLTKYLNKVTNANDITVYRGEGYHIFNSITLQSGESLGKMMEQIVDKINQNDGTTNEEIEQEIKNLISQVQDKNYVATQERFLSTSADPKIANDFGKITLILNLPAGSKASFIDATYITEDNTHEAEVLCQRGSNLQITDLSFDREHNRWCVHATVITN